MAIQSLLAKIGVDTKAFNSGLKGAEKRVGIFRGAITKLGTAIAGIGFVALARNAINTGSRISDLSEQLRINAEALQTLSAVAIKAGVEQKTMERAIRNVSIRTQEAIDGNKSYAESFERLGIDITKFTDLPTEKKIEAIAQAYSRAGKTQAAFTDVATILGQKAGPEMLEVLRRLNDEGLDNLIQGAKDTGQVMNNDVIKSMDEAADLIGRLSNSITVAAANILAKFEPAIKKFSKVVSENADQIFTLTRRIGAFVIGVKSASIVIPAVTFAMKAYTIGARGAAFASILFAKALTVLKLKMQSLLAATGVGLLVVGLTELVAHFTLAKDKVDDLADGFESADDSTSEMSKEIEEMNARMEEALSGTASFTEELDALAEAENTAAQAAKDRTKALEDEAAAQEKARDEVQKQFFLEKELEILRLKAQGKNDEAAALKKRVDLTKQAYDMMVKYGISAKEAGAIVASINAQEEAAEAARRAEETKKKFGNEDESKPTKEPETTKPAPSSDLTGHALRKAANIAGKSKGIRFDKMADGTFQQFINGKKGERFTEAQLQAGLGNQLEKDDTGSLLEKINKTLEGKFVSQ